MHLISKFNIYKKSTINITNENSVLSAEVEMSKNKSKDKHNIQTKLIHSGSQRSQNNETSEAIYLTSGYVYNSAEEAEARFKGELDGYIYSRYSNPNLTMLEKKLCEMEGAEAAIDGSIEHYSKKLDFVKGPKVVKTFE